MAVYGYCRVSHQIQVDHGQSLGVQQRQIEGYALLHGLTVDRVFVEKGVSGSIPLGERPEGSMMMANLKPGDTIIASRLDRCFRSSLDALSVLNDLKARKISLHMIDLGGDVLENGTAKLVFTILSAVSEAERDRLRERVLDVKRDQRARNRFLGGSVPFGWRVDEDKRLIALPDEQDAIKVMVRLKDEGKSLRAIADAMKASGFNVSHMAVKTALRRGSESPL